MLPDLSSQSPAARPAASKPRPTSPRRSLLLALLLTLPVALLGAPLAHAADEARTGDVVIDGVLDLLAAELSDTVILQWLATTEDEPRNPGAEDLIVLRRAGASDAVIVALLEKARGELDAPAAPPSLPPAAPATTRPSPTPPEDADGVAGGADGRVENRSASTRAASTGAASTGAASSDPEGAPATERRREDFRLGSRPFDAPAASDAELLVPEGRGAVRTRFRISNVPYWLEGEEPWSLFVYLNGEPLTYVSEGTLFQGKPLSFNKLLVPGTQRLMLFREKHDEDANRHLTKVMPQRIEFELEPGGVAEVEVAFEQTMISLSDPVSFRVAQNGRLVAESSELGGNPDQWQWLCDDLERTLDGDDDSRLEQCVAWRELWEGYSGPTRSQVLQAFSNFDYRPVPRDQNLH